MSSVPNEAIAKKRYKILARERSRLAEKGQRDNEIEAEMAKLESIFPQLAAPDAVKPLSASAASLLAFGEAMSGTQQQKDGSTATTTTSSAAPAASPPVAASSGVTGTDGAPSSTASSSAQPTAPLANTGGDSGDSTDKRKELEAAPSAPVATEGVVGSSAAGTTNPSSASPNSKPTTKTGSTTKMLENMLWYANLLNVVLRLWLDVTARPRCGRTGMLLMLLLSTACAVYHAVFLDVPTCTTGRWDIELSNPFLLTFLIQAHYCIVAPLFRKGGRDDDSSSGAGTVTTSVTSTAVGLVRGTVVFLARDLVPSLCFAFVAYHVTEVATGLALHQYPSHYC